MTESTRVVQEQVEAYNARDLKRFAATYADDVEIYRPPATQPVIRGREALSDFYGTQRFCHEGLHAEILGRLTTGNFVCDHERVTGLPGGTLELIAIYEIEEGRIRRVWLCVPPAG